MRILTTVGTSIFRNFSKFDSSYDHAMRKLRQKSSEARYDQEMAEEIIESMVEWGKRESHASAEMKCLRKIQERYGEIESVQLVASDTLEGNLCAQVLREILLEQGFNVYYDARRDVIKGLQVQDTRQFSQIGLMNLADYLANYGENYDMEHIQVAYNFAGGFKSIIPYVTIMAQLYKAPMFYIFEETDELIEIGQAPLALDYSLIGRYTELMDRLSDIIALEEWEELMHKNPQVAYEMRQLSSCYTIDGDMVYLNALGQLMYGIYQRHYFVEMYRSGSYFEVEQSIKKKYEKGLAMLCKKLSQAAEQGVDLGLWTHEEIKHGKIKPDYRVAKIRVEEKTQLRVLYKVQEDTKPLGIKVYNMLIKKR